jgi:hypothetical protein
MRRLRLALVACLLAAVPLLPAWQVPGPGGEAADYRLEFQIQGSAISRVLLLFPLRVFYEASVVVDLAASRQEDGSICFSYIGLPRPAYILRTLGFGGKTLALLTVGGDEAGDERFAGELLARWRKQAPEFASRIGTIKKFPHRLLQTGPQPFSFKRDAAGHYRDFLLGLLPRYRHHPAKTGVYFNVFPMLADLLALLNHRFVPGDPAHAFAAPLPAAWNGDPLDLSADLNRTAGLMEKAVKSLVTVQQKRPFRLGFHLAAGSAGEIEICGEGFPDVSVWKGFMIREMFRRVRLSPGDGGLLADELWLGIRNQKGQGGYGRLSLIRKNHMEDPQ